MKRFFLRLNDGGYDYQLLCLAQGLKQLGHSLAASRPFWADERGGFLVDEVASPHECDWVLMQAPYNPSKHGSGLDEELIRHHPRTVLVDTSDGLITSSFDARARGVTVILKQMTRCITYPENCAAPWAFGLSDELCRLPLPTWESRSRWLEVNHRNLHGARIKAASMLAADCRGRIDLGVFDPRRVRQLPSPASLTINAGLSGNRHEASYLDKLRSVQACLTVGGYFTGPRVMNDNTISRRLLASLYVPEGGRIGRAWTALGLPFPHFREVFQWDSWRFWETFAAGAVNVNLDLEAYGAMLPVMPTNWTHYVGLDFGSSWKQSIERLLALTSPQLRSIAEEGRTWATNHYSPRAVAMRLLAMID